MKASIITIALSACCLLASAQKQKNHLSESIHDDGTTMSIAIKGDAADKKVDYNRTFNVAGMSKSDKDALTKRIADSLGVTLHREPRGPQAPPPPPPTPPSPMGGKGSHYDSDIHDDGKTMHVKISGTDKHKTYQYERTFNVTGLTKADKDALLKHITDSIGVSKNIKLGAH